MNKTIFGVGLFVVLLLVTPAVSSANTAGASTTVETIESANHEALEAQYRALLLQLIDLLQQRIEQLTQQAKQAGITPSVLGITTSVEDAEEETERPRRRGGGGGSSSSNDDDDDGTEVVGEVETGTSTTSTTDSVDDTATSTATGTDPVGDTPTSTNDGVDAADVDINLIQLQALVADLVSQIEELDGDASIAPTTEEQLEMTADELQQLINDLLAQLAELQQQGSDESVSVCPYSWTRDLQLGSEGEDVKRLQQFLNADSDTQVAVNGSGSLGMETEVYDEATAAAVTKFQLKYRTEILSLQNLSNPTGVFDAATRAKANSLCVPVPSHNESGDEELEFSLSKDSPDSTDIVVDKDSNTNDVTIFVFEVEAEDGDVFIETAAVRVETPDGVIGNIVEDVYLLVEDRSFPAVPTTAVTDESAVYLFDLDEDIELEEGQSTEFALIVDFEEQAGNYEQGQMIEASIKNDVQQLWKASGYDDLDPASDFSGSASGDTHRLLSEGLIAPAGGFEFETETHGEVDSLGVFELDFEVTAIEGDFYFADIAGEDVTEGVQFFVDKPTSGSPIIGSTIRSTADEDVPGVFTVREGETETVTLIVTIEPEVAGNYRVTLGTIYFSSEPDGVSDIQAYNFVPVIKFRTDWLTINSN